MSTEKKLLVVDANIISHALTPNQTIAYSRLFDKLEKTYRFAVTGFTIYELSRSSDKLHRVKINTYINQEMVRFDLSQVLIDFSARVSFLYSKHKSTVGKKIGDGDIINASLAILKDAPVLTIDSLDYPTPFFKEIDRQRVEYESARGRDVVDTVYILSPDMQNIKYCFEDHEV